MLNTVLEGRGPLLNGLQLQILVPICFAMFITVIIYCDKHKRHCMTKIGFPKEAKTERLESKKNPQKPKKKVF